MWPWQRGGLGWLMNHETPPTDENEPWRVEARRNVLRWMKQNGTLVAHGVNARWGLSELDLGYEDVADLLAEPIAAGWVLEIAPYTYQLTNIGARAVR